MRTTYRQSYHRNSLSDSLVPVMLCLLIEKGLAVDIIVESAGMAAHIINIIVLIIIPMVVIHVKGNAFSLVGAMTVCMLYSVLFMKLWSYVQVNLWCRHDQKDHANGNNGLPKSRSRSQSISVAELREYTHTQNTLFLIFVIRNSNILVQRAKSATARWPRPRRSATMRTCRRWCATRTT